MSFYDLTAVDTTGQTVNFGDYRGKVVIVVNVASECGYTPQYEGLEKLYKELNAEGLEILAFPCNQFGEQEPGSNEEIQQFCKKEYGVTFKVFAKVEVNGGATHPVYTFLKNAKNVSKIQWNFEKFVVDKQGQVVSHHRSRTVPEDLKSPVQDLLKASL